jgi:hypothetical protein
MVRLIALAAALTFSFQAVAEGFPGPPQAGTVAQHMEWSRKFVHEPDTAGSLAGGTLRVADTQKCTPGTRVFDRLPFCSWRLRPACQGAGRSETRGGRTVVVVTRTFPLMTTIREFRWAESFWSSHGLCARVGLRARDRIGGAGCATLLRRQRRSAAQGADES